MTESGAGPRAAGVSVSVCVATFNGARHIEGQLVSILSQLASQDEVVLVDDASTDQTLQIVENLDDPRIRVIRHERNAGHVRTFVDAVTEAQGDVVLLADQDDLWLPGRVERMVATLARSAVVATSLTQFRDDGAAAPSLCLDAAQSTDAAGNIARIFLGRTPYYGCAMGFRADFRSVVLPIPDYVESHDLWLALAGNTAGSITHLAEPSVARRLHGSNLSPTRRRAMPAVLRTRANFVRSLLILRSRTASWRRAAGDSPR
jgi:glycosyltransferase involved in cell wall biosynthesis